jgi:hypothetical protein
MNCEKCGNYLAEDAAFCPSCGANANQAGTAYSEAEMPEMSAAETANTESAVRVNASDKQKRNGRAKRIGIIAAAVVGIAILVYLCVIFTNSLLDKQFISNAKASTYEGYSLPIGTAAGINLKAVKWSIATEDRGVKCVRLEGYDKDFNYVILDFIDGDNPERPQDSTLVRVSSKSEIHSINAALDAVYGKDG